MCSDGLATDHGLVVYSSDASGGYNNNLVIQNNSNTTIRDNIECSGGLALNGAKAFHNTSSVDAGNYSNTY